MNDKYFYNEARDDDLGNPLMPRIDCEEILLKFIGAEFVSFQYIAILQNVFNSVFDKNSNDKSF